MIQIKAVKIYMTMEWYNINTVDKHQKSVKVNTERLSDLDRFSVMNDLLTMPVEELKWFQKILGKF